MLFILVFIKSSSLWPLFLPHIPNQTCHECTHPCPTFLLQAILCLVFKIPFPGFVADGFSDAFPFLQTADGDPHGSCKGLLSQPQRFPIDPDAVGLSVTKESVVFILQICLRHIVKLRQFLRQLLGYVLVKSFFNGLVGTQRNPQFFCRVYLP